MDKYKRNYILEIEGFRGAVLGTQVEGSTQRDIIQIRPPFTIEFDIKRDSWSSANFANIRIYNLNKDRRSQIQVDQFNFDQNKKIAFAAGYGDQLAFAFKGNISSASSVREGVNYVTTVECYDAGFAFVNALFAANFPTGTSVSSILDFMIQTMKTYGVDKGAVSTEVDSVGPTQRPSSYIGNTTDLLDQLSGGKFFVDNGKAYVLGDKECLAETPLLVNSQTGLLGTPTTENRFIKVEMLFEPNARMYQLVNLQAEGFDQFNGECKIISIHHRGMISEAVAGTAITTLGLLPGKFTGVRG